jgi:hypothetical protein
VSILVPGRGLVNASAMRVDAAVKEYDERLCFGFNEARGDWIVYIKMERGFPAAYHIDGVPVYPIRGFGNHIPTPPEVLDKIKEMDTWHNNFDLATMNWENEKRRMSGRSSVDDAIDEAAQRMTHAAKQAGLVD